MNPIVIVFAGLTLFSLRKSPESAVIDVLLPALFLVPFAFAMHIPHLPTLTCIDAVLLLIGLASLATRPQLWKFQRADVWVIAFTLAAGYTDFINLGLQTALFNFPSLACEIFFAYVVGKLLIEQGGHREKFAQRLVSMLAAVCVVSVAEFIAKKNIFLMFGRRFQSTGYVPDQMRGRFLRIKGPFAGPEQAGIVLLLGIFLALWLFYLSRSRGSEPKYLGIRRSALLFLGIALGLYMTLSRGPWIGAVAGFLIARVGMVKNRRMAIVLALALATVGGVYAKVKTSQLAQISADDMSLDESTSSAYYRTQLYTVYKPVAERGGLFGWSGSGYPRDPHLDSIDNEYILLWVAQGMVGLGLFILIALESMIGIIRAIRKSRQRADISLYYCLGGFLVGLLLVLATVYLTAQGYVLFFMLAGWTQSLRDQSGGAEALSSVVPSRFTFKRVFA